MRSKESLRVEIRELMKDLAGNGLALRLNKASVIRTGQLLHCRTEILKSIAHRQGLMIEILETEAEYLTMKEAA
jgi:hypothetical protein